MNLKTPLKAKLMIQMTMNYIPSESTVILKGKAQLIFRFVRFEINRINFENVFVFRLVSACSMNTAYMLQA